MSGSAGHGSSGGDFAGGEIDSARKNMGAIRSARLAGKHVPGGGHYDTTVHSNVPHAINLQGRYHTNPTAPGKAGHNRGGAQGEVQKGGSGGVKDMDVGRRAGKLY